VLPKALIVNAVIPKQVWLAGSPMPKLPARRSPLPTVIGQN